MGDFSKTINFFIKKKLFCAFVCVSLGLKKPGDFTVSEGHGYPLVINRSMKNLSYSYLHNNLLNMVIVTIIILEVKSPNTDIHG